MISENNRDNDVIGRCPSNLKTYHEFIDVIGCAFLFPYDMSCIYVYDVIEFRFICMTQRTILYNVYSILLFVM